VWEISSFWETDPFEHFYQENAFPEDMYEEMLSSLPKDSEYKKYNDIYPKRFLCKPSGIWKEVESFIKGSYKKCRVQLCRDFPGYSIGPHTDGKREQMTVLFYLTDKTIENAGTSVYTPKDESIDYGFEHYKFEDFNKVKTVPFARNTCFGFKRSGNSFHGVEPVDSIRNLIQLSVYK
jgi:hypothetical protein